MARKGTLLIDELPPIETIIGPAPKKKPFRCVRQHRLNWTEEAKHRFRSGDWKGASAPLIVALYCLMHEAVYGLWPCELDEAKTWRIASFHVANILRSKQFDSIEELVKFTEWVWRRENERVKWRAENNVPQKRVHWRQCFSNNYISDYRVFKTSAANKSDEKRTG